MPLTLALFALWALFLVYAVWRWVRTWRTPDGEDGRWIRHIHDTYPPESDDEAP